MKVKWLSQVSGAETIIYFTGWSMDGREVEYLANSQYNVLCVYDYSSLELTEALPEADYVVAWSFGVAIAELLGIKCRKHATAFAGSTLPVSDKYGISPQVFGATVDGYSEVGRKKFLKRIGLDMANAPGYSCEQKSALLNMAEVSVAQVSLFDRAVIATKDRIFLPDNLRTFWQTQEVDIVEISSGHFPFSKFANWHEVLSC